MVTYKTEFQALNKAVKVSKKDFADMVVVVFKKEDGLYSYALEAEYTGRDENICEKYLNGVMVT